MTERQNYNPTNEPRSALLFKINSLLKIHYPGPLTGRCQECDQESPCQSETILTQQL